MRRIVLFAVALVALSAAGAAAQTTATAGLSATLPEVLAISSSGSFDFGTVSQADYDNLFAATTSGPSLTHRGNVAYYITAEAAAATLSGGSNVKPASDVAIYGGSAGTVSLNGTTPVTIHSAAAGSPAAMPVGARLALSYANDPPGTYSTTITFTILKQ
jgi:spore coat protein U-like protein